MAVRSSLLTPALAFVLAAGGCGVGARDTVAPDAGDDAGPPPSGVFRCVDCLASSDCGGDPCIQYGSDVACAPPCAADGSCPSGASCAAYPTSSGEQVQVCVPDVPACGTVATDAGPPVDAGAGVDAGMPSTCGGLVSPGTAACCTSCTTGMGTCGANGCYGGWWCNSASCRCQPAPTSCGAPDAGTPVDAGPPPPPLTGSVGPGGGTVSRFYFAVVGDTRPATEDDTAHYPTAIINREYADIEALSPRPQFTVATGDYCFARPTASQAHAQMSLYLAAKAMFSGTSFFAMGNHECTGRTSSNCGASGVDGITNNYTSFLNDMLAPIHQTRPYYSVRVDATDGSWTSKLVVAAPNAWDSTQDAWLRTTLATPTTYTFVVRHEPMGTSTPPPGLAPMDAILAGASYTLLIVGHTHTYHHFGSSNEVTIGLGGAPPTASYDYGFLTVAQLPSGDVEVRELDYMTGAANDTFRVHPDGTRAP